MKKQLLSLMTLFISVIGYSQTVGDTFVENFITYEVISISPNTVEITDYNSAGGTDVDILATVLNNSTTYNVTSIDDYTFLNMQLTSVVIPNSIINISTAAFAQNQLTSFTIPNSVISIGSSVLTGNPLTCVISEATTPPTITTGGSNDSFATNGDRSNIDLSIPSGTASAYATAQWTGFNSVAEGLTGTFVVDHITYQINPTPNNEVTVTDYNTTGGTVVDIPATVSSACTNFSVTAIGNSAFFSNNLSSISIPTTVAVIGIAAFRNNQLTSVTIPDSVFIIENGAFRDNPIMNVVLSNNLTTVGDEAFGFNNLQSLTIPDSVLTIGDGAFGQNNNMTTLTIGNSVTSIGGYAFRFNALTNVTIPASVTNIDLLAFDSNPLTDVTSLSTTPPTIITGTNDTFLNRNTIHLHIPGGAGVLDAYTNATNGALWTGFNPVTQDALNISDFELANNIKIFNTKDELKVTSNGSTRLENYTIYSISGAKIKEGTESTIAIDAISNGIYIIELNFDNGQLAKKFIK